MATFKNMELSCSYYHEETDQQLTIYGILKIGRMSLRIDSLPREPDDEPTVQITMITDEKGRKVSMSDFSDDDIELMKEKLLEC